MGLWRGETDGLDDQDGDVADVRPAEEGWR